VWFVRLITACSVHWGCLVLGVGRLEAGATKLPSELLGAKLDGYGQVHGSRLTIEHGGLVLPLLDGVKRGTMKQTGSGNDLQFRDVAGGVDQRVDLDVSGYVLRFGHRRINRCYGLNQLRGLHFATNGKRNGRCVVHSDRTQRFASGTGRLGINGRQSYGGLLRGGLVIHLRSSETNIAETGFQFRFGRGRYRSIGARILGFGSERFEFASCRRG